MKNNFETLQEFVLGELLFYANSSPSFLYRTKFYEIKNMILDTWGSYQGVHLQHIQKPCYNCEGTGKIYHEVVHLGQNYFMYRGMCGRCSNGVYDEFWTISGYYKVGRRFFHLPIKKYHTYEKDQVPDITYLHKIEGYVRHETPRFYLHIESTFWLLLFFDWRYFLDRLGKVGCPSAKFTPMVLLTDLIFRVKHIPVKIRTIYNRFKFWHQSNCDHMFPEHDENSFHYHYTYYDLCPWCGIRRIDVHDDIPF